MLNGLPPELWANALGFVGYALFALSPLAGSRGRYLALHGIAMLPIAAHYVLLEAMAGALLSLVYLAADLVGSRSERARWWLLALAGAALAILIPVYESALDLLALAGTFIFLLSRATPDFAKSLIIAGISTIGWGVYGWLEGSYSQVLFSAAYALFCAISLMRQKRFRRRSGRSP